MKIGKIGNATLPNIFHHINYVPPNAGLGYGIIASQHGLRKHNCPGTFCRFELGR